MTVVKCPACTCKYYKTGICTKEEVQMIDEEVIYKGRHDDLIICDEYVYNPP